MVTLGWTALGLGALIGIGSGIANIFSADEERKAQISSLEAENTIIEEQMQYNEDVFAKQEKKQNEDIAEAQLNLETYANISAQGNIFASKQAYEQMNQYRAQAAQNKGATTQKIASSGFKRSGTLENIEKQTISSITRSLALAEEQTRLSIMSNFYASGQSYYDQTKQIEAYRYELALAREEFERNQLLLERQMVSNNTSITELENDKDSVGQGFIDFFAGWFS